MAAGRLPSPRRIAIKQRIVTALIILPALIAFLLWAAPPFFAAVLAAVAMLALHEFYAMAFAGRRRLESVLAILFGGLLTGLFYWQEPLLLQLGLALAVLGCGSLLLARYQELEKVAGDLALTLFGLFYLPLLLGHLTLLRQLPHGREWVFLVLIVIMIGDSAAYFTGITLGKHRLYPAISPKKSVEGALGGLAGSVLGALASRLIFFPALGVGDALLLGAGLGLVGQVGDLFESMLKRAFGVKDSGTLIPGHGGLLDRLDSLLFAFPPAYYYALWAFRG